MEEKFNCAKTMFSTIITLNINKRTNNEHLEKLNKIEHRIQYEKNVMKVLLEELPNNFIANSNVKQFKRGFS